MGQKILLRNKNLILIYSLVLFCWFLYRFFFHNSELVDELIFKPFIWLLPLLIFLKQKEKHGVISLLLIPKTIYIIAGYGVGIGLPLLQIIPNNVKGGVLFHPVSLIAILPIIGTAIVEEVLFRGYIFNTLLKTMKREIAITITSILFVLIHIPLLLFIQHLGGSEFFLALYILLVSSIVYSILFLKTKNLWPGIIAHFLNNVLLVLLA